MAQVGYLLSLLPPSSPELEALLCNVLCVGPRARGHPTCYVFGFGTRLFIICCYGSIEVAAVGCEWVTIGRVFLLLGHPKIQIRANWHSLVFFFVGSASRAAFFPCKAWRRRVSDRTGPSGRDCCLARSALASRLVLARVAGAVWRMILLVSHQEAPLLNRLLTKRQPPCAACYQASTLACADATE